MPDPYLGEIRVFAGTYAPAGWRLCNGDQLSVSHESALFSLIGNTYGGDGISTFNLPNLNGRVALGQSSNDPIGAATGASRVTLSTDQIPRHTHPVNASTLPGSTEAPGGRLLADSSDTALLAEPSGPDGLPTRLAPEAVSKAGASEPHPNQQPYLALTYIIALKGVYPPRG